jgi:hypothetical protein
MTSYEPGVKIFSCHERRVGGQTLEEGDVGGQPCYLGEQQYNSSNQQYKCSTAGVQQQQYNRSTDM